MTHATHALIAVEIEGLLILRPITESLAMAIKSVEGYRHLLIENGEWVGLEGMTSAEGAWMVIPSQKLIEVYDSPSMMKAYGVGDVISGGELLPHFELDVAYVFEA